MSAPYDAALLDPLVFVLRRGFSSPTLCLASGLEFGGVFVPRRMTPTTAPGDGVANNTPCLHDTDPCAFSPLPFFQRRAFWKPAFLNSNILTMPGRIKPKTTANTLLQKHLHALEHTKPRPRPSLVARQEPPEPTPAPAPNQDDPAAAGTLFENQAPDAKGFVLNKQTIIWLVVISVIVLATLITVTCLLCKCKRRRKGKHGGHDDVQRHANGHRWHPSLEVKDGRNDFPTWNRAAPPRASLAEQGGAIRMDTFESADTVAPLVRAPGAAAMRGGNGNGGAVMEPVVVDYATGNDFSGSGNSKKSSRYYSNLNEGKTGSSRQSWWKRMSQIGRAY